MEHGSPTSPLTNLGGAARRAPAAAAVAIALLALGSAAGAGTWYVDTARPDDTGDGLSWAAAKQTIGAAISASGASDTILVNYGTYAIGEALVLTSDRLLGSDDGTHDGWAEALPDSGLCIVAADATCRVLTISGAAVTGATVVRGFTFTGGDATSEGDPNNGYGGGVDVNAGADPVIERCRVAGNLAGHTFNGSGGGISVRGTGSAPEIRHCRVDDNTGSSAWYAYGGGVYCGAGTAPHIHDCTIAGNRGSTARVGYGGGIACSQSDAIIRSCAIVGNIGTTLSAGVGGRGGGIYIYPASTRVESCTITDNVATEANSGEGHGGGIYTEGGANVQILDNPCIARNIASVRGRGSGGGISTGGGPLIRGNVVEDNVASASSSASEYYRYGAGGGIRLADSNTRVLENIVRDNTASLHGAGYGGGIYFESTNTIERNVIRLNVASAATPGYGGGAYTGGGYRTSFRNNTVVANANVVAPGATGAGSGLYHGTSSNPYVENNIFCDHDIPGSDGVGVHSDVAMPVGYNCFDNNAGGHVNALVTSSEQIDADPQFTDPASGDFTLRFDSPCIEAGNPATTVPANGGWRVDCGAFEYTGARHWRAIAGAGEYLFGGRVRAKVNLADAGALTAIDMVVHPGERHPEAPGSVARYYAIEAAGSGALFDLTLSYLDEELEGEDEGSLALWRRQGSGWEGPKPAIAADMAANWLTVGAQTGFSEWVIAADLDLTGVGDAPAVAAGIALGPNRPNPFNPRTTLAYRLPFAMRARLTVHDVAGRLVRTLEDADLPAGDYSAVWDGGDAAGRNVGSGSYFARLRAGDRVVVTRMSLVR